MGKRGPQPGFKRGPRAAAAAVATPPTVVAVAASAPAPAEAPAAAPAPQAQAPAPAAPPPASFDSLQRGRNIDLMGEDELRAYARQIGLSPRDAAGLSVERLRQNCTAHLYDLIDAL